MARMGELVVSNTPDDVLVSIGLGSCIGLALVEPSKGLGALAHIMLPEAPEEGDAAGGEAKFADVAVPRLVERMRDAGALPSRMQAAVVGGASMFAFSGGSGLDIGPRNEREVLTQLERCHVRVLATATGGTTGRTMRVHVADGRVTVKTAGGTQFDLLGGEAA
jgi:chemotaxis protein CheD